MTACDFPFEMLSAYVDGQLQTHEELEVRRHLDGCAHCRQTVENLSQINRAIAATSEVHPVPHALRERLHQLGASKAKRPGKWLLATTVAAAVLLVALGVWRFGMSRRRTAVQQLAQALIEDHVRYLGVSDAIQVASHDPRRIADSFNNRVGFPIKLPHLSDASLLGARFCRLKGHKAVLSFYEREQTRISLFVLDRNAVPGRELPETRCESLQNYRVCLVPAASEILALVAHPRQARAVMPELERFEVNTGANSGTQTNSGTQRGLQ